MMMFEIKHWIFLSLLSIVCAAISNTITNFNCLTNEGKCKRDNNNKYNRNDDLPTLDMIKLAGYPAEAHVVTTDDGYLLTLHRIPRVASRAVLLQHGLLGSSSDWIITGPTKSLAYLLYDRGYDVWFGNARGNTYSRAHTNLSTSDPEFWNFSFHEMGTSDLPAVINFITTYKGSNLIYIGHSMGTTMGYIMATERPDVASKVQLMISLAPVAFMKHIKSPVRLIAPYIRNVEFIAHFLGINEFLPENIFLKLLARYGCDLITAEEEICENALFVICGFDDEQFDKAWLPVILNHDPAGCSTKTMIHYGQEINSGHFRQYDYGARKNVDIYNSVYPPDYNLTNIQVPVALFYADNDWLAATKDVEAFYRKLPNPVGLYKIKFPKFNHLDFLWAIDGRKLLYDQLIDLIDNNY